MANLALVTGANSGLGFAVAQELASSGNYHVIVGSRTITRAEHAIDEMLADPAFPASRDSLSPVALDLSDDESVRRAALTVKDEFGSLDILINSAGVGQADATLGVREQFRFIFDTNVFGAEVLVETFLPLLRASRHRDRRIVHVTSGAGQVGLALSSHQQFNALTIAAPAYRSSKAALNMLAAVHAMQLRDEGIASLVAAPGPTHTRFSQAPGGKDVHQGAKPIIRAATEGDPSEMTGTLVADEATEYGW